MAIPSPQPPFTAAFFTSLSALILITVFITTDSERRDIYYGGDTALAADPGLRGWGQQKPKK